MKYITIVKNMACYVRLMQKADISQVMEIDREAFPTLWPPPNYRRELENRLARYLVACDDVVAEAEVTTTEESFSKLLSRLRQLFNPDRPSDAAKQYIFGFAGLWIMAGEAHITTIAVKERHRRQGIGELLLISLIDLALEMDASLLTLEVRASNTAAQSLYSKYGFTWVGVRRGYYADNREDAVLMSLENITSTEVQANLQRLKQAYSQK
jgi:ribosomal-protein-alanine N-acetyltransferase